MQAGSTLKSPTPTFLIMLGCAFSGALAGFMMIPIAMAFNVVGLLIGSFLFGMFGVGLNAVTVVIGIGIYAGFLGGYVINKCLVKVDQKWTRIRTPNAAEQAEVALKEAAAKRTGQSFIAPYKIAFDEDGTSYFLKQAPKAAGDTLEEFSWAQAYQYLGLAPILLVAVVWLPSLYWGASIHVLLPLTLKVGGIVSALGGAAIGLLFESGQAIEAEKVEFEKAEKTRQSQAETPQVRKAGAAYSVAAREAGPGLASSGARTVTSSPSSSGARAGARSRQ